MELNHHQHILIKNFCEENDYDYRTNYSGRGMYGKGCIGITGNNGFKIAMELALYLVREGEEDLADSMASHITWDSMGRDVIVYFPFITVSEQKDGEDEDENEFDFEEED